MKKGLIIFVAICVVLSWGVGIAAYLLQETMGQYTGLLFLPLVIVPIIAAFIAHRFTGATGNPYKGLVWGPTGMIFGAWLLGLVIGYVAVLLSLGLGLQQLDLTLGSYLDFVIEQSASQDHDLPEQAYSAVTITGWVTVFASPLILVWFAAAIACISLFPWLGWFLRRILVHGKVTAGLILAGLFVLVTIPTGLIENPQLGEMSLPLSFLLMGVAGGAGVPLILWLFLKTRSAVIPAIAQVSVQMAAAGSVPLLAGGNPLLCPPSGLLVHLVVLGAGLALWIWKDPGGDDLAVAAVAYDGTPLTPEMVAQLEAEESAHQAAREPSADPEPAVPDPLETDGTLE